MKQLLSTSETSNKLIGKQKYKAESTYRLSRYCISVPCEEGTILYHTLTDEMLLLSQEERPEDFRQKLIEQWFLVPEDLDEYKMVRNLKRLCTMLRRERTKQKFTILTTTDCNARCFYCFEMGEKRFPMQAQTAHAVAAYIARASGGESVKLGWFGGEPLYNQEAIRIITGDLRKKGIDFVSRMTSNGFYLDADTVQTAMKDWKLRSVQISLDGTRRVYNKTKAYINSVGDDYERVLQNIGNCLDAGIAVQIRLNMDSQNAADLDMLIDELAARFGGRGLFHVYLAVLQEFRGKVKGFDSEVDETEAVLRLQDKLDRLRLSVPKPLKPGIPVNFCMADDDNSSVIMADGSLITCEHYNMADTCGHVSCDGIDMNAVNAWKETIEFETCRACALYPKCIRLKKCPSEHSYCWRSYRELQKRSLQKSILNTWEKTRQKDNAEEKQ